MTYAEFLFVKETKKMLIQNKSFGCFRCFDSFDSFDCFESFEQSQTTSSKLMPLFGHWVKWLWTAQKIYTTKMRFQEKTENDNLK